MFFSIEFGMLSSPGALLLPRYLRHRSYVILSNVFVMDACISPRFSSTNPFKSCHLDIVLFCRFTLGYGLVDDGRLVWPVG
jgi:hypothetical protein